MPRLGFLSTGRVDNASSAALREGLSQAGQVEGRTFSLEARFSEGENDRLPALAAELLALPVDLVCVIGAVTVRAVGGLRRPCRCSSPSCWIRSPMGWCPTWSPPAGPRAG